MRMLVLGAGLQGSACAYDLLQQPGVERVTIADLKPDRIPGALTPHVVKRLALLRLEVQNRSAFRGAARRHGAVQDPAANLFTPPAARAGGPACVPGPGPGRN